MKNNPTNAEIVDCLEPWFPTFSDVFLSAEEAQLRAVGVLGLPRRGERSGDWHRALRNNFRIWCDETNNLFRMIEERDGLGLDCIVCTLIDGKPFAIRFGHRNKNIIKRNRTLRQCAAASSGVLSSDFLWEECEDVQPGQLRQVTLAHRLAHDETLGGVPAWYMDQVSLVREWPDSVQELAVVATFEPPASIFTDPRRVVAVPRAKELAKWRRMIGHAQSG